MGNELTGRAARTSMAQSGLRRQEQSEQILHVFALKRPRDKPSRFTLCGERATVRRWWRGLNSCNAEGKSGYAISRVSGLFCGICERKRLRISPLRPVKGSASWQTRFTAPVILLGDRAWSP